MWRKVDVEFQLDCYAADYKRSLTHIREWVPFTAKEPIDIAGIILKEMLCIAR
jgi:hypothetical protein